MIGGLTLPANYSRVSVDVKVKVKVKGWVGCAVSRCHGNIQLAPR